MEEDLGNGVTRWTSAKGGKPIYKDSSGSVISQSAAVEQAYTPGSSAPASVSAAMGTGENLDAVYQALLKYSPQIANQEAQTNLDILKNYSPQQLQETLNQLQTYQPQFQELNETLRTSDRNADLNDVIGSMSKLQEIQTGARSPEASAIRKILSGQIEGDLASGEKLTPEQQRSAEQSARTADMSRGIGSGRGSANREAVRVALEGRKLKTERQNQAGNFLGQEYAQQIDPILAVTGRPSTAATSSANQVQNAATPTTNAQSGTATAQNLYGTANTLYNQDLNNQQYDLSYQLAQKLANEYGWSV